MTRLLVSATLPIFASFAALAAQAQTVDGAQEGPFDRLAIVNAMVIPGHGGPAYGPADIVIEGDRITPIRSYNGATGRPSDAPLPRADRVIDATAERREREEMLGASYEIQRRNVERLRVAGSRSPPTTTRAPRPNSARRRSRSSRRPLSAAFSRSRGWSSWA